MQPGTGRKKSRSATPVQKGGWRWEALKIAIGAVIAAATAVFGIFGLPLRWWAAVLVIALLALVGGFATHALRGGPESHRVRSLWVALVLLAALWVSTVPYVKYVLLPGPPAVVKFIPNKTVFPSNIAGGPPSYPADPIAYLSADGEYLANCYTVVKGVTWLSIEDGGWARAREFHLAPEDHAALPKQC